MSDIEFLSPRPDAFGDDDAAGPVTFAGFDGWDERGGDDGPRSRWSGPVAGLVVLALVAAGVLAAAPWADDGTPSTPSTTAPDTTVVASTAPAPSTTDVLAGTVTTPVGWIPGDPPEGMAFAGASSQPVEAAAAASSLAVWTEPFAPGGAPDPAGRWLTVRTPTAFERPPMLRGGSRVVVGDHELVVAGAPGEVTVVTVRRAGEEGLLASLRAHGLDAADVMDLATQLHVLQEGWPAEAPPAALDGLVLAWSGLRPSGATGLALTPTASVTYWDPRAETSLRVDLVDVETSLLDLAPILLTPATTDAATDDMLHALAAAGRPVTLWSLGAHQTDRWLMAVLRDGDQAVTVSGFRVDPVELLRHVGGMRPASEDEWLDLLRRTNRGLRYPETPPAASLQQRGSFTDGSPWRVRVADGYFTAFVGRSRNVFAGYDVPPGAAVQTYADPGVSVVLATARWPNRARTAVVTLPGQEPVVVPMQQLGDTTVFVATYAHRELGPATVELLDRDGNPVPLGP